MAKTRVGLLGAGYIAKAHAAAIRSLDALELHAVCDRAIGRARSLAGELGVAEVYGSIEELAGSECDVVHILLPPSLHLDAAERLISAGKNVFIEKPMGTDAAACAELEERARGSHVRIGVNHNFLFIPAYQSLRDDVHARRLGDVDHLALNWHYELPQLHFGPFDGWMFAEPRNLVLELGSHLAAFALDLLGPITLDHAMFGEMVTLANGKRVFRKWTAIGRAGRASVVIDLATTPGRVNRSLTLRSLGAVAHVDFDKGLSWRDVQASDNPVMDNLANGRRMAGTVAAQTFGDFSRYFARSLRSAPSANPFEDSIQRSVAAFYSQEPVDQRVSPSFGAQVIALCSAIGERISLEEQALATSAAPALPAATAPADTLVVGGTGFIGKRLVQRLVAEGHRVRVLTRGLGGARIELAGLPVELVEGNHGDPACVAQALAGIKTVFHLAKANGKRWDDYVRGDIEPTRTLALAAIDAEVKRFVYTSTIDSFASADRRAVIATDTPLDKAIASRNLYARSKAACEQLLTDLARTSGLKLVIARLGIVIGADAPPTHLGVAQFLSPVHVRLWGDGDNPLPFVLVDDVADALVCAARVPDIEGRQLLVTDAPLLSARDYVAAMAARAGIDIRTEPRAPWRYWVIDAAKEALKNAVRHPNRRASTEHDWACRTHRARYDSRETCALLGWTPAGTRAALIERGINPSVDRFLR